MTSVTWPLSDTDAPPFCTLAISSDVSGRAISDGAQETGKLFFLLAGSRLSVSGKGSKNRVDDKRNQRRAGSIWTRQRAFSIVPSDREPGIGYFCAFVLFRFFFYKKRKTNKLKSCVVVRISLGVYWLTANLVDRLSLLGLPCRQASQQNASKCLPTHGVPMNVIQRILTQ